MTLAPGTRLGPYDIVAPLGAGGMGEVYRARDTRLGREVAIKVVGEVVAANTETLRRFRREAQLLAAVTHPNVCQIFDLGEHEGMPYLAMELLAGESLHSRMAALGPLAAPEALGILRGILAALGELHSRGIVHRDLKPSNVFLTPHGIKLLDFGVARQLGGGDDEARLTRTGTAFGTPRYMAPEQWNGEADARSDVFACGALLYEMVSGSPAFPDPTPLDVIRATLEGRLAPLAPEQAAIERLVRRALSPHPADRFPSAAAMAEALESTPATPFTEAPTVGAVRAAAAAAKPATRLLVLPFRLLRPDPEIDFLSTALADAIGGSLAGFSHLIVRSSRLARADQDDLARLAQESAVDAVLCGTLLRAGERVRVSTQLIEAPSGTVVSTSRAEATLRDLFELQDDLARQVVEALRVPLQPGEGRGGQSAPHPEAYELYLRAVGSPVSTARSTSLLAARELLARSVVVDANFAPAWAQLGRMHRLLAKYGYAERAESVRAARRAFETALALDPNSALVHNLYTHFEIEELASPVPAMLRLLAQIETHPSDAALYAGLVTACRYTGLLAASLAAHARARALDPQIRTGVHFTHWMLGEWARAAQLDDEPVAFARHYALPMLGRADEAIRSYETWRSTTSDGFEGQLADAMVAALRGDRAQTLRCVAAMTGGGFADAEGLYFLARSLAYVGALDESLELLETIVELGFTCPATLALDPWLEPLRPLARFQAVAERAEASHRHAEALFLRARGPQLLGMTGSGAV